MQATVTIKNAEIDCTVDFVLSKPYHYHGEHSMSREMQGIEDVRVYAGKQHRDITKFVPEDEMQRLEDLC